MIHGHYGDLASFDYLGPLLTRNLRVVAYDQRGHGWSETGPISVDEVVADLATVINILGLEHPILYGSSFGTLIGLAYLMEDRPARAFITEDGQLADFPAELPKPAHLQTIVTSWARTPGLHTVRPSPQPARPGRPPPSGPASAPPTVRQRSAPPPLTSSPKSRPSPGVQSWPLTSTPRLRCSPSWPGIAPICRLAKPRYKISPAGCH